MADYRAVEPELGGEAGFRRFLDAAHLRGLGVLMDIVYNHTSPDSILAREHPEWFWKGPDGAPGPRGAEWSDVADLDYGKAGLWKYQIETLESWLRFGADGFRCDVASLVPLDFWAEARRRCAEVRDCLWLAESVHPRFLRDMRRRGLYAACEAELHEAFDMTYDYDGRECLDLCRSGQRPLSDFLRHLYLQECMYPAGAVKARFLENHDMPRAAKRFGRGAALRNWTAFAMLLPGAFFAYMGQELALEAKPCLFEKDPVPWEKGDREFETWFAKAHAAAKEIRGREPVFDAREVSAGVVLAERRGGTRPVAALFNLEGRSGEVRLPFPLRGVDVLDGTRIEPDGAPEIPEEPRIVELD